MPERPNARTPERPIPVILDCDPGIDDALALLLAARSPEIELLAVTTVAGNARVEQCTPNALRALAAAGAESIPVVRGEAAPLRQALVTAPEIHDEDGLGGVAAAYPVTVPPTGSAAPEAILELLAARPDAEIVAVGPLTNLARAIERDRERMRRVPRITVMGGAFRVYGNTTVAAEFNVYVDPDAAQAVLDLGVPLTIVPLDVTERVALFRTDLPSLRDGDLGPFVTAITDSLMRIHQQLCGFDGCYLHDPLTLATVIDPSLIRTVEAHVQVEIDGRVTRGMTVADLRPYGLFRGEPNARVAVDVDADRFRRLSLPRLNAGR
jgi:purine nucleosidase/pyrimidine-specific ribonucleoside hydrolase